MYYLNMFWNRVTRYFWICIIYIHIRDMNRHHELKWESGDLVYKGKGDDQTNNHG